MTDAQDKTESTQEEADEALRFADGFSWLCRVLHSRSEHGLEYEDVTFPARDGVPDYKILHDAGYNVLAYDPRQVQAEPPLSSPCRLASSRQFPPRKGHADAGHR